ncbi:probable receptor expression-enhancing protein 4 [Phialocephala subalpina]|uniref:Protein YOP1 n=1 Tax=Phialocephala subalpina TaxID=576137 RepID=A0A1L7X857_9HELO|nr:probable receptor expression-enhancing protein 4 [Phialocephala subalpina]
MFFSTFANLLSSVPTFLFPVFASYKALKTNDPALLQPWLMYWVVLAIALFVESWTGFILFWVPFYAWIRLIFLLYLILPQTQGAKVLYQEHVHPFLQTNEHAIDDFISSAHDRAKSAGITYLKQFIEIIKTHVLGLPPKEPTPPPTPTPYSYTQSLIARFNIPSARPTFPAGAATSTANDFYSLLASAVSAATSRDPAASSPNTRSTGTARDLSNSGTLIPPSINGSERLSFISAQRERLSILLSALDKEASTLSSQSLPRQSGGLFDGSSESEEHLAYGDEEKEDQRPKSGMSGLSSRKSEPDFEKIDAESGAEDLGLERRAAKRSASSGGSWMPWSWGASATPTAKGVEKEDTVMDGTERDVGKSSGVDA